MIAVVVIIVTSSSSSKSLFNKDDHLIITYSCSPSSPSTSLVIVTSFLVLLHRRLPNRSGRLNLLLKHFLVVACVVTNSLNATYEAFYMYEEICDSVKSNVTSSMCPVPRHEYRCDPYDSNHTAAQHRWANFFEGYVRSGGFLWDTYALQYVT